MAPLPSRTGVQFLVLAGYSEQAPSAPAMLACGFVGFAIARGVPVGRRRTADLVSLGRLPDTKCGNALREACVTR